MSEIFDNGGPAFPTVAGHTIYSNGMSLRDWFAGQVLAGIMSGYWANNELSGLEADALADQAYRGADAMLAARRDKP